MVVMNKAYQTALERQWNIKFPAKLSGLFAFYQCLCTITIVGCEVGSILIDLFNATIYVGFWASIFFMIAWILQTISASCRRTRQWATYTLIIQCIALVFAACVIGFDAYFLSYPTTCFFSSTLCNSSAPTRGLFYTEDNFNNIKIPLIKGQLACASLMFAFSIDYIIIYVVTRVHVKKDVEPPSGIITPDSLKRFSTHDTIFNINESKVNNISRLTTDMNHSAMRESTLESSMAKSINRSRWSVDSNDMSPIDIA